MSPFHREYKLTSVLMGHVLTFRVKLWSATKACHLGNYLRILSLLLCLSPETARTGLYVRGAVVKDERTYTPCTPRSDAVHVEREYISRHFDNCFLFPDSIAYSPTSSIFLRPWVKTTGEAQCCSSPALCDRLGNELPACCKRDSRNSVSGQSELSRGANRKVGRCPETHSGRSSLVYVSI